MNVQRKNNIKHLLNYLRGRNFLTAPCFFYILLATIALSCNNTYKQTVEGVVLSINTNNSTILVKHNDISGLAKKNETNFRLYRNVNFNDFSKGDRVSFEYISDNKTKEGYTKNYKFISPADTYNVTGVILEIDTSRKSLMIRHDVIPGFMDAMTMEFSTDDKYNLFNLSKGDSISFMYSVNVSDNPKYSNAYNFNVVDNVNVDNDPFFDWDNDPYDKVEIGGIISSTSFLDKDSKKFVIEESDKLRFISFIFSRCPDKTMCHAIIDKNRYLADRFKDNPNIEFIIISFDYLFDTPDIINKEYKSIEDSYGNIKFLSSYKNIADIALLARQTGFRYSNVEKGKQIGHSMKSIILNERMALLEEFDGKEWKSYEAEERIRFHSTKYN